MWALISFALGAWVFCLPCQSVGQQLFDVVIVGGRVMDPESGLDAIRNVGVTQGAIRRISRGPVSGRIKIDARGLILAPGFIDLHAHGQDIENNRLQAMDGVATAIDMEGGTADVPKWYAERAGKRILNYGVTVDHNGVRSKVMRSDKDAFRRASTPAELIKIKQLVDQGLGQGALGIGMGLEYSPAISHDEVLEMCRIAAKYHAPCHVHIRYGSVEEPGSALEAVEEMIAAAAVTSASIQVVHISSMGLSLTPKLLPMIAVAEKRGLDVTTECYPYTAFATGISSAVFDPGWQKRFGIDYADLQWAQTGERLTAASFEKYQKTTGTVIAHAIPEAVVRMCVASPLCMIASDGDIKSGKGHPRGAGTFSRVLGKYVREEKALSLMLALKKMTLMPARRLETRVPGMRNKGRIRVGADADITVFDPAVIADQATFEKPAVPSVGVRYLLVNGEPVVKEGKLQEKKLPGKPVRAEQAK